MKIPIDVSADRAEPMYHQIEEQLRALILSGQLAEGVLLPSIREFAADLSCSVITIRRVYQDLEQEGFLRTRQGTGTFVAKVAVSDRERYRRDAVYEALKAAVEVGRRINCTTDEIRSMLEELLTDYGEEGGSGNGNRD
ncbi:GntR family transcriptional regulator [Paenibacillus contaminans]|uniref:GntR family transcriptional regulator n=1 Tax=Paenibacillus contaminans TaxID=450362 RepID=A0A329LRQ7_9BACL|nr:GntR family transcriptional regulator [Paenibacillus contaminans]RAV10464.1 GntR family transcriptional regulator [Paenibacillus contaminans]